MCPLILNQYYDLVLLRITSFLDNVHNNVCDHRSNLRGS